MERSLTVPFWCLIVIALLPQGLAAIGDYFRKKQFGELDNHLPRAQYAALTGAGARARGAELNAWEALPVFAVAVLVAYLRNADAALSAAAAILFVAARLLHAAFYIADLALARSTSFLVGLGCCVWLFVLAAI